MALVHQIIDFVDDTDKSILKLATAQVPDHLKSGAVLSVEDRERLGSENFALVLHTKEAQVLKKFPVTDEVNSWLSCRYFEKTSDQLPFVAQKIAASNLKRACLIFNLDVPPMVSKLASVSINGNKYDEVKSMKEDKMHRSSVKTAQVSPDNSENFYALGDRYPMPDASYVKKAADYFSAHHKEFTDAEDRSVFAAHVRARASELDAVLEKQASVLLQSYAGDSYGDSVERQLKLREEILQHKPEMVEALSKLASHKASTTPEVFAKALYLFDKKARVTKHYDSFIADAFKSTFGNFRKTASAYSWEDEQSDVSVSGSALEKAAEDKYEKIKSYFGATLADSLKKHAVAIFDSLPADAKVTIAKIANGAL